MTRRAAALPFLLLLLLLLLLAISGAATATDSTGGPLRFHPPELNVTASGASTSITLGVEWTYPPDGGHVVRFSLGAIDAVAGRVANDQLADASVSPTSFTFDAANVPFANVTASFVASRLPLDVYLRGVGNVGASTFDQAAVIHVTSGEQPRQAPFPEMPVVFAVLVGLAAMMRVRHR